MLTTTATIVSLIPLTPITLSNQYIFSRCTSKSSYDVPSMTKIMVLQMTSMSSRQHTPHQLALEQLTTSWRSHVASVRSDTPKTSSEPSKNMTVAPTQVFGSRCTTLRPAPVEAMKTTWRGISPLVMGKAPLLWLDNLSVECITSWETLSQLFRTNYQATYNRPGNTHHLARVQMRRDETL
jgi:hypothetical protein